MPFQTLDQLSLLKISGADATGFLQGQLTNDLKQLDSQWQLNGYCSPKGRLLTILRIWPDGSDYYALLPQELTDKISQRLRMYVMRSKVFIEHLEGACIIGLNDIAGLQSIDPVIANGLTNGNGRRTVRANNNFALIDSNSIIYISMDDRPKLPADCGKFNWHDTNVLAGIPEVVEAISELFVPQMVNLDLLDGISFKKGCYTGQEIVARMHYLGKLKQRMFLCEACEPGDSPVQPGDTLFVRSEGSDSEEASKRAGTVVSVSSDGRKVLAVIRLANRAERLVLQNGRELTIRAVQPYPVEA